MVIDIDDNSGFCFGVDAAVRKAEEILSQNNRLYCLGDIVHNETEVERLSQMGLITIDHAHFFTMKDTTVLLRAHGEPPSTYEYAIQNNIRLIDATCPIVLKLQQRIHKSYESSKENSSQVVIYGKMGHAEVNGLSGQTDGRAIIIGSSAEIGKIDLSRPVELYAQTTKDLQGFRHLGDELKMKMTDSTVKIHDTICRQVSNRIPGIREFASRYSLIFVSGQKSSNGIMLYGICQSVNPNSKFITSINDIDTQWFTDVESVGICGATSTPQNMLEKVADVVKHWAIQNLK